MGTVRLRQHVSRAVALLEPGRRFTAREIQQAIAYDDSVGSIANILSSLPDVTYADTGRTRHGIWVKL